MSGAGDALTIIRQIQALRAQASKFALCLVAHTEGSSYRKPGAIALVTATHRFGVISGGCREPDLEVYARQVIATGEPRCVVFDTVSDRDLLFGSGSGCRGRTHILVLPDEPPYRAFTDMLLDADQRRLPLEAVLVIEGLRAGSGVCSLGGTRIPIGAPDTAAATNGLDLAAVDAAIARICIKPVPRVIVVGAGPEAAPLVHIVRVLGWKCLAIDHRPVALQTISALCDCHGPSRPGEALSLTTWTSMDAVIVMTHSASIDLEALRALSLSSPGFIGLLGPAARRDELLSHLDSVERGALEQRLHSPVGLNLGGHGPEAIALSIAAELQHHFFGSCG